MDPYDPNAASESEGEDDFGAIEMFDSNSQLPATAPVATAAEDEEDDDSHLVTETQKRKDNKHKKSKKKSTHRASDATSSAASEQLQSSMAQTTLNEEDDEAAAIAEQLGSSQLKRKRKTSEDADGKRRKKHSDSDLQASTIVEEQPEDEEANREAPEDMDVDESAKPRSDAMDVEKLALEAFNEHMNGHANGATGQTQLHEAPAAVMEEPATSAEPQVVSPKRSRTNRGKKAKPTYFEQPAPQVEEAAEEEGDEKDPLWDLPSPAAGTPKPRRAKPAAKKGKGRQKLAHSMHGGQDSDGEAGPKKRKSKSDGYIQGRFTDEELDAIKRAIERFRDDTGRSQQEVNEMIHAPGGTNAGPEHSQLWESIFAQAPGRYRQKIINTTRKNFHNYIARGTWTIEQDQELRDLIQSHGTKWSLIGGLVNRHPEDLRDRYRNYIVCGDAQRKDAWTEDEESRMTQFIIEAMEAIDELRRQDPDRELLHKSYDDLIDWQNISERMDRTRSRLQCITKWKSMNMRTNGQDKLVSREPDAQVSFRLEKARRQLKTMPEEERYRLVLAILGTQVGTDAKIPWAKLVDKQFRKSYHRHAQVLLWQRLKKAVSGAENKTIRDIAQELVSQYEREGGLPSTDDDDQYDVQEEQRILAAIPSTGGVSGHTGNGSGPGTSLQDMAAFQALSAAIVGESDDDDNDEQLPPKPEPLQDVGEGEQAMQPMAEMQIDPALIAAAIDGTLDPALRYEEQQEELPAEEAAAAAPPAVMETPTGKKPKKTYKKKSAKKSSPFVAGGESLDDPIEDPSPSQEIDPDVAAADAAVKSLAPALQADDLDEARSSNRKKKTPSKFRSSAAQPVIPSSPSLMDDMEDVPARLSPQPV